MSLTWDRSVSVDTPSVSVGVSAAATTRDAFSRSNYSGTTVSNMSAASSPTWERMRQSFFDHWEGAVCGIVIMALIQIWLWRSSQVRSCSGGEQGPHQCMHSPS